MFLTIMLSYIVDFHETFDRVDHQALGSPQKLWNPTRNHNHHSETVQKIHMSSHPWGNPD